MSNKTSVNIWSISPVGIWCSCWCCLLPPTSDIPENILICLLTYFYPLFFLPWSEALHYKQINYIQCLLPVYYTIYLFSSLSLKKGDTPKSSSRCCFFYLTTGELFRALCHKQPQCQLVPIYIHTWPPLFCILHFHFLIPLLYYQAGISVYNLFMVAINVSFYTEQLLVIAISIKLWFNTLQG